MSGMVETVYKPAEDGDGMELTHGRTVRCAVRLVEVRAIQKFNEGRKERDRIEEADTRGDIVTSGVKLKKLVGRRFRIGSCVLEGRAVGDGIVDKVRGLHASVVAPGCVRYGDSVKIER